MVHLDTNAISILASNEDLQSAFFDYLSRTNEALILNYFQMMELIKSSDSARVNERISFLRKAPRKRLLVPTLIEVVFHEIADFYLLDRTLSKEEFREKYTIIIESNDEMAYLANTASAVWDNVRDSFHASIGGDIFSKVVSQYKTGISKLRVRDFVKPKPNPRHPLFDKRDAERHFDRFAPDKSDTTVFCQYMNQVRRMEDAGYDELIRFIENSMQEFYFPNEVWDWKIKKFMEQAYFMRRARHALRFFPDSEGISETFFKKINTCDLSCCPSFFISRKLMQYLNDRPTVTKPSDSFDIFYAGLLPYVDVYTCDNEIASALTQIIRSNRLEKDRFNYYTLTDFRNFF